MAKITLKKTIKIVSFFAAVAAFAYFQNKSIVVSRYVLENNKLPEYFDGMKIVHVSDLQDGEFGENNSRLISKIKAQKPDIIVISGDIIDCHRIDIENSVSFAKAISELCPVYYVCGNHEGASGVYPLLKKFLEDVGVTVLENESCYIDSEEKVRITGIMDPYFKYTYTPEEVLVAAMEENPDALNIVLCHRPELFDSYVKAGADIVFTGHAHGGQIRLPFIGGLFAPNQGIFPKYTSGVHEENGTSMVVSRGLGNSVFPLRVFNRPEVVVVELKTKAGD